MLRNQLVSTGGITDAVQEDPSVFGFIASQSCRAAVLTCRPRVRVRAGNPGYAGELEAKVDAEVQRIKGDPALQARVKEMVAAARAAASQPQPAAAPPAEGIPPAAVAQAVSDEPEPEHPEAGADPLLASLDALKISALKKRALALGATAEQMAAVTDADDRKAAAIQLILSIRDVLQATKLSVLEKRLRSLGATEEQMDELDDVDDTKASAVQLIMQLTADTASLPISSPSPGKCMPYRYSAVVARYIQNPL